MNRTINRPVFCGGWSDGCRSIMFIKLVFKGVHSIKRGVLMAVLPPLHETLKYFTMKAEEVHQHEA